MGSNPTTPTKISIETEIEHEEPTDEERTGYKVPLSLRRGFSLRFGSAENFPAERRVADTGKCPEVHR